MKTFGQVVKALRQVEDLTLDAVAKKIGTHKGYVSGIENGKVNPPAIAIVSKFYKLFRPTLEAIGVQCVLDDLVELAWVSKSPKLIRDRAFYRIRGNPLARLEIRVTERTPSIPAVPQRVDVVPTPPRPGTSDLLPGEKEAG